ncbi:hypothetical protein BV22DRAFT_1025033, partial [Leucogyrophana mollusca]
PYHTSALLGQECVIQPMMGHPEQIHCELGMYVKAFTKLIKQLQDCMAIPDTCPSRSSLPV